MKFARLAIALALALLVYSTPVRAQTPIPVLGVERIGFDQAAPSVADANAYRYAIYVDGTKNLLAAGVVTCTEPAGADGFPCSTAFVALTPGAHTLEATAAIDVSGTLAESLKSAPLDVRLVVAPPAPRGVRVIRTADGRVVAVYFDRG